jgi:dipeptidyl aminopeptidase/acylaminoacyl peptidase
MRTRLVLVVLAAAFVLAGPPSIRAQRGPSVQPEIYLAHLSRTGITGPLVDVSNNPGYDSQPSFLPDSSAILFSSERDGKQYDIYRYDIARKEVSQVTHSAENENSPLVMPGGKTFSAVRTELDATQRLWQFDLDGSHARVILEHIKPVGYHAWIDATHVALFVLGAGRAPATLQIADTTTGTAETVDSGIGRALFMDPGTQWLMYLKLVAGQPALIKEVDPHATASVKDLFQAPAAGSQDAAFAADGRLFMADGSRVVVHIPGQRGGSFWATAGDFSTEPMTNITRMAVSPDGKWIAIVAEPVSK